MKKQTLLHQGRQAIKGFNNDITRKTYRQGIRDYNKWAKRQKERVYDFNKENVQKYANYAYAKHTPQTAHTYVSGVCRVAGLSIKDLDRANFAKRTGTYQKGRNDNANLQGKKEADQAKYKRLVTFQKVVGIRRDELKRLTGKDLYRDEQGRLWVHVDRGKGGKTQEQYVLPQNEKTVEAIFANIGENESVFSAGEMNNKIDLHSIRRENSQVAYEYFLERIENEPTFREKLRAELIERFERAHVGNSKYRKARLKFYKSIADGKVYRTRGNVRKRAEETERPTEYNELALMAVSILCLAHWRNDVTVERYMIN